jgi:hypothetical protein
MTGIFNGVLRSGYSAKGIGLAGAVVLSLMGCVTEEKSGSDSTPPDHSINLPKPQDKYLYGVTDTLTVDFSEPIDTSALRPTFSDTSGGIGHAFRGKSRMLVFGKPRSHGEAHFPVNLNFSMTLAALRDLHGNPDSTTVDYFAPIPWIDKDFLDQTFNGYDSLFASETAWQDGSPVADSFVSEGSLDFKRVPPEEYDIDDFKLIRLVGSDTVTARLTSRKDVDLKVEVFGPYAPDSSLSAGLATDTAIYTGSTGTKGVLNARFAADEKTHKRKLGSFDAPGIYVLKLTLPQNTEGFYRLGLRIRKFF